MKESKHYDVFVIGTGIAGQTAAKTCAKNGMKVAMADNRPFGGTCALRGCDPKKVFYEFTSLVDKSQRLKNIGVSKPPKIKWKDVQNFKSSFTNPIPENTEKNLAELGIDCYHQSPIFQSKNEILVEGELISADTFVIATGQIPRDLDIEGKEYLKISDDVLNLNKIPKSAIFIGSGYVGIEFACMLTIMGCKVTMVEQGPKALIQFDSFLVEKLISHLELIGITFLFDAEVRSINKLKKNLKITYKHKSKLKSLKARKVFNTTGRVPSIAMLELEKGDIKSNGSGVLVNDYLQSVSNPNVYACGDVSSKSLPLTPLSGLQGHMVGNNIIMKNSKKFAVPCIPSTVFSNPNLSSVGFSEEDAKRRYKKVKIFQGEASDWFNARKENNPVYAFKILVNERTDEILGAHLLSSQANETINIFSTAIQQKMTVAEFKKQMFTYPSYSSDLKSMLVNHN
ncbi:MAG: NAD(P)/FAD-dependent oxidoreductase [Aquaticitalea sp.]